MTDLLPYSVIVQPWSGTDPSLGLELKDFYYENKTYRKLKDFMSLYKRQYAFFYYKKHKIWVGRGFSWEHLKDTAMLLSLGLTNITFYCTNQATDQMTYQWDYRNKRMPSSSVYYVPYNWLTTDIIFAANVGKTRTSNTTAARIFSVGERILSTVVEIIPADAYTTVTPARVEVNGEIYGPKQKIDQQFMFSPVNPLEFTIVDELIPYDFIIIYPFVGEWDQGNIPVYVKFFCKGDLWGEWETTSQINKGIEFYGIEIPRPHLQANNMVRSLTWRSETGDSIKGSLTNIFLGQRAIVGNKTTLPWQFTGNTFYQKIEKQSLTRGKFWYDTVPGANGNNAPVWRMNDGEGYWFIFQRPLAKQGYNGNLTITMDNDVWHAVLGVLNIEAPTRTITWVNDQWVEQSGVTNFWGDIMAIEYNPPDSWTGTESWTLVPETDYNIIMYQGLISGSSLCRKENMFRAGALQPNFPMEVNAPLDIQLNNYVVQKAQNFSNMIINPPYGGQDIFPSEYPKNYVDYNESLFSYYQNFISTSTYPNKIAFLKQETMDVGMRTLIEHIDFDEINSFIFKCDSVAILFLSADTGMWQADEENQGWLKYARSQRLTNSYTQIPFKWYTTHIELPPALYGSQDNNIISVKTNLGARHRGIVQPTTLINRERTLNFINSINTLNEFDIWISQIPNTVSGDRIGFYIYLSQ